MEKLDFFGKFQFDKFYFPCVYEETWQLFPWQGDMLKSFSTNKLVKEKLVIFETRVWMASQGKYDKCME